ncbi:DM13 domain-containing protein [Isoptericola sp. F-RaC21]|uniref:DM13 domain-containing protein n=1 Tax=Isoptericola sp. F-RaC21 TaxID=3141452 RepID=UPI00315BC857
MRAKALTTAGLVALALTLTACGADDGADAGSGDDMTPTATESMPSDDMQSDDMQSDDMASDGMQGADAMARHGSFAGLNDKSVEGTVAVDGDTLTLEGFSSDEGPDLHLYLANGTDEAAVSAGTELGDVAWDEASQTFTLDGVDASGFTDVVVHCDKAKAVFGAATLM